MTITTAINGSASGGAGKAPMKSSGSRSVRSGQGTLPLDLQPAAFAFSVGRRLRTSYKGMAFRVRRSSDQSEQDINYNGGGLLDTASLLAFCGAGDGFISRWYDQSGYGRDVTCSAPGNQPKIVAAGAYLGEMDFSASATAAAGFLLFASQVNLPWFPFTASAVLRKTAAAAGVVLGTSNGAVQMLRVDGQNPAQLVPGVAYGTSFNASAPVVLTHTMASPTVGIGWANGANLGTTNAAAAQGLTVDGIGAWNSAVSNFALRELILFPFAESSPNRQAVERNQGAFYGVAVS